VAEIVVEGASFYSAAQVIAVAGLKVGDAATKETFERARDRVLESGCFESFGWRYEPAGAGVRATLQVTEPEQFLTWMVDRAPVTAQEFFVEARKELPLFGAKIPTSERFLERAAGVLERMAAAKGQKGAMTGRVLLVGKDQIRVVFGPKAPPPVVVDVEFEGARVVDARYLRKVMADVAVGAPYLEVNFRLFLESQMKPVYEAVGRLRASFPRVVTEPKGNGVLVRVTVEEGEPYKLTKITVDGSGLGEEEIEREGNWKTDQTVSYAEIGRGVRRIQEILKGQGYMKSSFKALPAIDEEKKTVEVRVEMERGEQYRFGKLLVKGLDIETEPELRRLWALKEGEPYRGGYAAMFLNQVRERGVFDNLGETKYEERIDEKGLRVDVLLTFAGEKRQVEKRRRPEQE